MELTIALLIVCNIPVYLFIAWIVFGGRKEAADSFWETLGYLLYCIFVPSFVRIFSEDDYEETKDKAWDTVLFLLACVCLTGAEIWLLGEFFH